MIKTGNTRRQLAGEHPVRPDRTLVGEHPVRPYGAGWSI
jgi:hypothetical protein